MDDADPRVLRVAYPFEIYRLSLEKHLSFVAVINAGNDLHQSGFSRSILAQEHMDLPAANRQIHLVQRKRAGKSLCDPFEHEQVFFLVHSASSFDKIHT